MFKMIDTGDFGHNLLIGDRADIFCPAVDSFSKKDLKFFGNDRKGLGNQTNAPWLHDPRPVICSYRFRYSIKNTDPMASSTPVPMQKTFYACMFV